jgi:O-antigen ligase
MSPVHFTGLMNRETLDKFCERGILVLVLAILVFTPLAFGGKSQPAIGSSLDFLFVDPFNVVQRMTLAVMLLWGARLWLTPRPKLLWPPICWAVVAFVLYAVIRYFFSEIEYAARGEMIEVLMYAFLFLAIVNNLHRQESAQIITLTLVFLAMAISIYAIYQFVTNSNRVWALIKPYAHRGSGTFISPNNLSGFLEMILPLGLAYTITSRLKALPKVFTGYASLVIIAGLVVTVSRGSWFASAVALLIFFGILMFHHTHRVPAMVLLAAIIIGSMYFGPRNVFFQSRITELTPDKAGASGGGRFDIWQAAVKLWHENIWWGIGPAHFNYRFGKYRPELVQASPDRVHNDYLNTLTDWGVVGVVIVAAAWILLFVCMFWTWRYVRGSPNTLGDHRSNKLALVLGTTIGLVAILIHSAVDFNMHIPANAIVAITLMALLSSYIRFATERYWFTARPAAKTLLTLALLTGLVYLGWQSARSAQESIWLMRAQRTEAGSDAQIAALQKAFSTEPRNAETARAIGEAYRIQSWQNNDDFKEKALEAMKWFKRATELNPYDDSSILRIGMCLDWIGQHDEAFAYFDRANRMDPNSYFNNAYMGWHYAQAGDYAAAREWLQRSRMLKDYDNPVADAYFKIAEDRLMESATNSTPAQIHLGSSPNTIPPWK